MADKNEMISANRVYGSLLNIVRKINMISMMMKK